MEEIIHSELLPDHDLLRQDHKLPDLVDPDLVDPDLVDLDLLPQDLVNKDLVNKDLEIIHLELPVVQDHHDLLVNLAVRAVQCLDHALVLFVPVLQLDHNALISEQINVVRVPDKAHQEVGHKVLDHIDHNQVERHVQVDLVDQVAPDNVQVQAAHLEKVAERKRVTRARKLFVKR